ncbi:MAG: SDR family oxidoreductase [Pirellulaceae bacterium]|jgi:NAD(P)-dependent dehydrogenase (short-subunit alcohol dehydrogenase family)|nr:SDR family oxidoreductase [Pirellulaceae bacterium]
MPSRIAVVTGAGRGIGRSIATKLAARGDRVAVTARTAAELDSLVDEIQSAGGDALAVVADLSDRAAPQQLTDAVRQHWGEIEILVNNAGVGSSSAPQPLIDFDDEFWDLTMMVNVTAPYLLTKLVLPGMIGGGWGRIVNISSINARIAAMHGAAYTASKHALAGLTKATAKETGDTGVTCNAVCPGPTKTLMNNKRLEYDADRLSTTVEDLEAQASPLGRRIQPDEVASMSVYLTGDDASGINGQLINVCGGVVTF